ncbi:MAG: hypothetical protein RI883_1460 [Bacteroidota bacterium]|jgi:hypothetical protein
MKKFLVLFFFLSAIQCFGQLNEKFINLTAKYSVGKIDTVIYNNFSFTGEIILHKYVGVNYNFDYLLRNDNVRHIHSSMGLIGGPILIGAGFSNLFDGDSTSKGTMILVGIAILALPDGVSFHIPASYKIDVSPYANVLGLDFIKNRTTNQSYLKYAASFGVKTTYLFNEKFTLAGFVETRKTAGMLWGIGGGIGVGMAFD